MLACRTLALATLPLAFLLTLSGCGGDGGTATSGLATNACSTIGLNTKIINGTPCEPTGSPVVMVNLYDRSGESYNCSGSVVTAQDVLTAGHCFLSEQDSLDIEAASITIGEQEIFASAIIVPRAYREDDTAVYSDAAVLKFARPLNLPILPIIVNRKVTVDDVIAIYGYGADKFGSLGTLRSGEMLVDGVTPNHLFSTFGLSGSNTCFGDSGGPAVLRYVEENGATVTGIVGITSSGSRERCETGDRSLFANVQEEPIRGFLQRAIPGIELR